MKLTIILLSEYGFVYKLIDTLLLFLVHDGIP
jgi:hypothetical protein